MSRRYGKPRENILRKHAEALLNARDEELVKVVEDFLSMDPNRLGKVTDASIRKLHASVVNILDRVIEGRFTQNIYTEIAHAKIFVQYQGARGQLSRDVVEAVDYLLSQLNSSLRRGGEEAARVARRVRLFLDSLVTLTKKPS